MSLRGYARFYADKASGLAPVESLREAFDPYEGNAEPDAEIDSVADAMLWRRINARTCDEEIAHALALDHEPGRRRLKAIVYRAYQEGDAFADAMVQDREDWAFAKWATDQPLNGKEQTLASLLDLLAGGGAGLGGSDFAPSHVRLFTKLDGGAPWEAFGGPQGILRRAIGVIERDPSGAPGEAEDLFCRAQDAIRCLDEIRTALVHRRECAPRFSAERPPDAGLASAIAAFFTGALQGSASVPGRLARPSRSAPAPSGFSWRALEWRGTGAELHVCLRGLSGVPDMIEAFLDELDAVDAQRMACQHELGFERDGASVVIWPMHRDSKLRVLQAAKRQDLPLFFFVARLAEVFVASTGEVPTFSNSSARGTFDSVEARWLGLFHGALDATGLVSGGDARSNDNRATLLKRLAGRAPYSIEGAANLRDLKRLSALFGDAVVTRPIGWGDGFVTDRLVRFMRPFRQSSSRYEEKQRAAMAMALPVEENS